MCPSPKDKPRGFVGSTDKVIELDECSIIPHICLLKLKKSRNIQSKKLGKLNSRTILVLNRN